jgi:hypothetical protein
MPDKQTSPGIKMLAAGLLLAGELAAVAVLVAPSPAVAVVGSYPWRFQQGGQTACASSGCFPPGNCCS